MKVLYITGGLGGESRELETHLEVIKRISENCEIHVVVLYDTFGSVKDKKVKLICLNTKRTLNPLGKLKNLFYWIKELYKLKKSNRYDLSISNADPSNIVNLISSLLAYKTFKTSIIRFAGMLSNIALYQESKLYGVVYKAFYRIIFSIFYNKSKKLSFISKSIAADLSKYGIRIDNSVVAYNPIDLDRILTLIWEKLEEYEHLFSEFPVIITAGRLTKPKGQWYLLRVFRQLKETHKDLKLVILGEGELKEYLIKLSEELGLRTFVWDRDSFSKDFDVYFLGFQKNPFKFIARSKLFVFPSLWEGFPYALVEAMACGVPVVSSDCRSGPREILAPNTDVEYQTEKPEFAEYGVLMPMFDVKFKSAKEPLEEKERMWVEVLDRMLRDESLRMEYYTKSKKRAEDFRIERVIHQWIEVLHG